jgi:dTDP-4-dehydrorhamnose reductase
MTAERVLIVGSNGLLGQKVVELLVRGSGYSLVLASMEPKPLRELISVEYHQLDITSKKDVRDLAGRTEPRVIINCAAMTNVDACETEREAAWKINVGGVENLAEAARRTGARLYHVSTDYVFDGKNGPYAEDDRPDPLSYYGKTKLASENALRTSGLEYFIARTMVLYGYAAGVKPNFALWLIQSLGQKTAVRVVDDQWGNPTLVDDLAYGIVRAVELGKTGVYHIAGRDIVSRYEFAVRLARFFGYNPALIKPVKTADLAQPAPRPLRSGLVTLKAETELGITPATIEQGLAVLKSQLSRTANWENDSRPVPLQNSRKPTRS